MAYRVGGVKESLLNEESTSNLKWMSYWTDFIISLYKGEKAQQQIAYS